MRRSLTHNIICWSLLLYLTVLIIPPLSAIRQAVATVPGIRNSGELVKDYQHTTLYLYDILIWQSLKKTQHTAKQLLSAPEKTDHGDSYNNTPVLASSPGLSLSTHSNPEWYNPLLQHSRSADIHFARSGISPPSHSQHIVSIFAHS
ncbi:MAG: hypothetical protein OEW15_12550 [Nitrospirota bacterium]|nr:hypothetical protein [Nitrospirota bacterium]